jgi:hypothetical protein
VEVDGRRQHLNAVVPALAVRDEHAVVGRDAQVARMIEPQRSIAIAADDTTGAGAATDIDVVDGVRATTEVRCYQRAAVAAHSDAV